MATHTMRKIITLGTTAWVNHTAADFASMGGVPHVPSETDRIRTVYIVDISTQALSVCYGGRTGSADAGARGLVSVPEPSHLPKFSTLTMGNQVVTLARDGDGDSGAKVDITGLTRTALRTKITALLTAAATGTTNLVSVDGPTTDLIIMQADAGQATVPIWSQSARAAKAWAAGLAESTAAVYAVGDLPAIKTLTAAEDTSILALRSNVSGCVVTLEIEVEGHGSPVSR